MCSGSRASTGQNVKLHWNKLYINADQIFGTTALPLPKYLLKGLYTNNKPTFTDLSYWSASYIGLGPYQVKDWELGSSALHRPARHQRAHPVVSCDDWQRAGVTVESYIVPRRRPIRPTRVTSPAS